MTLIEITEKIEDIFEHAEDDEVAHGMEDALYKKFIAYVALHGDQELKEMANKILSTQDINFDRWCA